MAIKVQTLVNDFNEALAAGWRYVSPGGTNWSQLGKTGVDCSGLFTAAFKRHGGSIYHGSNTMARKYTNNLQKLTKAGQLVVGSVVYKWQNDGDEPSKYQADGKGNFHHVGLVVSVSPLKIVHASSVAGKVTSDSSIKKWAYCGMLKGVTYASAYDKADDDQPVQEDGDMLYQARVVTGAAPLNVRSGASQSAQRIGSVPKGAVVNVYGVSGDWSRISYNTTTEGWCASRYLKKIAGTDGADDADEFTDDDDDIDDEAPAGGYATHAEYEALLAVVNELSARVEALEGDVDAAE